MATTAASGVLQRSSKPVPRGDLTWPRSKGTFAKLGPPGRQPAWGRTGVWNVRAGEVAARELPPRRSGRSFLLAV